MSRRPIRALAAALVVAAVLFAPASAAEPGPSAGDKLRYIDFSDIQENRANLGLAADASTVRGLAGSAADVGTLRWGIPMTAAEEATVDLPARGKFANRVSKDVLPLIENREDFGGLWIDGPTGDAIVGKTRSDPALQAQVASVLRGAARKVRFVEVPHAWADLENAGSKLFRDWSELVPGLSLVAVRVNAEDSAVIAEVAGAADTAALGNKLSDLLGVAVRVQPGTPSVDVACTTRDNCYSPYRAGIIVRNGSPTGGWFCTMNFMVHGGSYENQFLTAGHCTANHTPIGWYHKGNAAKIGNELGSLLSQGIDAMRVNILPESQASDLIWGAAIWADSYRQPILNETLCASLGATNVGDVCAKVTDTSVAWRSTLTGYDVTGADLAMFTIKGDSGSPIYTPELSGPVTAVGLMDTGDGHFARMGSIMAKLPGYILCLASPCG